MAEMTLERWETLVALRITVGPCAKCGGPCFGEPPVEAMGRVFFDSRCADCGHESTAPGGRSLPPRVVVPFRRRPVPELVRQRDYAERAAGND
jgi:hypothetical protein